MNKFDSLMYFSIGLALSLLGVGCLIGGVNTLDTDGEKGILAGGIVISAGVYMFNESRKD